MPLAQVAGHGNAPMLRQFRAHGSMPNCAELKA
jgi:hypothetical protein